MRAATPSRRLVGLMAEGVKLSPPECFEGDYDGESVKEFIVVLETYFYLVGLKNDNTRALFAKTHLMKLARIWYDAQGYADATVAWS